MNGLPKITTLAAILLLSACANHPAPEKVYPKNYREIMAASKVIEIHGETADSTLKGDDRTIIDNLDFIIANNHRVAVLFSAYWCKDSYKFDPYFKEAAILPKFSDVIFAYAEVDGTKGNENFRKRFELPGVPVVILFEDGKVMEKNGEKGILFGQEGDKTKEDLLRLLEKFDLK